MSYPIYNIDTYFILYAKASCDNECTLLFVILRGKVFLSNNANNMIYDVTIGTENVSPFFVVIVK